MKKFLLMLFVAVCLCGIAMAVPTGWDTNAYYTYQQWGFDTNANPASPDVDNNPYGTASASMYNSTWVDTIDSTHEGGWRIQGPINYGMDALYITVPNEAHNLTKEFWIEIIFRTHNTSPAPWVGVTCEGGDFASQGYEVSFLGYDEGYWFSYSEIFEFYPQPDEETFFLRASLVDASEYLIMDSAEIATRCIPEPATMSLLALGGLAFLRRKHS